jgi:hypothetical protein
MQARRGALAFSGVLVLEPFSVITPMRTEPAPDPQRFDNFMSQAWQTHAIDPEAVAARLSDAGLRLASTPAFLGRLVGLMHHVHGTHLGAWDAGTIALTAVREHPQCTEPVRLEVQRALASLALCRGDRLALPSLTPTDRLRVSAMAADHLAESDTARASVLWQDALAQCSDLQPPPDDPSHRALAVTGNHMACALEQKPTRTPAERQVMIDAAAAARRHWALAGTWLEVERAEYRLARTWLKAGDAERARVHALACQAIVLAQGAPALEQFFAAEALALCAQKAGDAKAFAEARTQVVTAFDQLDESDRGWCRPSLEALGP